MMAYFNSSNYEIIGMSSAVPSNTLTYNDFTKRFDEKIVNKFQKSTGIHEIHCVTPQQTAGDLGYEAAIYLIQKLKLEPKKIQILLYVSLSDDYRRPATASVIHKRLNLSTECASMDIGQGCAGFIYGHQVMTSLLNSMEQDAYGLMIVSEALSKLVNPKDRTSMLFGDAGSAIIYKKSTNQEDKSSGTLLYSDGSKFSSIIMPAGGFRNLHVDNEDILCSDGNIRSPYNVYMNGLDIFSFSIKEIPEAIEKYLHITKTTFEKFDVFAFHQANKKIIETIQKYENIPHKKIPLSLEKYGNTSGSSIPLLLCDQYGNNSSDSILQIMAIGFGVGLSWGITSLRLNTKTILPVIETDNYFKEGLIDLSTL